MSVRLKRVVESTLRGVDIASGLVISDLVVDLAWDLWALTEETRERLFRLYHAARNPGNRLRKCQ